MFMSAEQPGGQSGCPRVSDGRGVGSEVGEAAKQGLGRVQDTQGISDHGNDFTRSEKL